MKTFKTFLTANVLNAFTVLLVLVTSANLSYAQSPVMKDPVSFKLKNGMTVIVAENAATNKVFSNLSFEATDKYVEEQAVIKELTNTLLNQQLSAINKGFSVTEKGINVASTSADFEDALASLYAYIVAPDFTDQALDQAKAELAAHITAQDKYFPKSVTLSAVKSISVSAVKAYYGQIADLSTAYLTIAGNVKPSVVKDYAKKKLQRSVSSDDQSKIYIASNL